MDEDVPKVLADPEDELVFAVVSSDACPPCKVLSKALDVLEGEYGSVHFQEFKNGDNEALESYANEGILTIYPTILISDGEKVLKRTGGSKKVQEEVEFYSSVLDSLLNDEIKFEGEEAKVAETAFRVVSS